MIKTVVIFLLTFFSFSNIIAQDTLSFPQAWEGIWKGDLVIYNAKGLAQQVPMELHILPTDSVHRYTWTLLYGEDKEAGKRSYELVVLDAAMGKYAIDEKNSIQMEGYFFKDKFFSRFEVMNNLILSSQQLQGENLIFEILAGQMEAISVTGDQVVEGDTIPPVQAFPINVMQRAVLQRE